ncbi:response regulator transcription factor [uncultured Clostridium sp.]|uniref:response regulator transcription factor n=1 Tax=uncultured Clostridium sp. TaxID=59620 RepID=UPI0025E9B3EC|nr:response regulator transcription factor [uncultured Clostridium sp.]
MNNILLIEDDMDLQEGLCFSLNMDGYKIDSAKTRKEGEILICKNDYELIIMDCNLPDGNGFEICRNIRKKSQIPILMLTARDTEMDEVQAFQSGVDDYIKKPFSLSVLKLRMENLIRKNCVKNKIKVKDIVLDKSNCKIYKYGKEVAVSAIEYKLLLYLMENQGQVISKDNILMNIWDNNGKFVDDNIVSVNIRRLRIKIEDDSSDPQYIKTIHGLGYMFY